jgi:D-beta-D-heptose 7-phosphate kinase/D-beta-D-heptose 1-phosphate adenosyltransferase
MNNKKILVIGDCIIDHDVFSDCIGLSLETPTMKSRLIKERFSFGGAANVVNNLLALDCEVTFVTATSADEFGKKVSNWSHPRLKVNTILQQEQCLVKSRFWISRSDVLYKYLQVNRGTSTELVESHLGDIFSLISDTLPDVVLLVDYRNGIFDREEKTQSLIEYCKSRNINVISSSQSSDKSSRYDYFRNSNLVCMNEHEARGALSEFTSDINGMVKLCKHLNASACVTRGPSGAMLYDGEVFCEHSGFSADAADTTGAGDSFLAAIACTVDNIDLEFCNKWAAASTLKVGTYVPTKEDLNEIN